MEPITLSCPHCGFSKQIDPARIPAGTKNIKCPQCKESFPLEKTFKFGPEPTGVADSPPEVAVALEAARTSPPESAAPHGTAKFCASCGQRLHLKTEICPGCGVRVAPPANAINKVALLLITFFLGGMGGHKFYQKKYGLGLLYLLFFWTYIPSIAALVEFIIYACKSESELQQRYPETSSRAVVFAVVVPLFGIALIGILAAIAIPQFASYRAKAFNAAATSDLRACKTQAEMYFVDKSTYPRQRGQLQCQTSKGVSLSYLPLGKDAYQIISFHTKGSKAFLIGGENAEMSENTRQEITSQLSQRYGAEILEGAFHFIE